MTTRIIVPDALSDEYRGMFRQMYLQGRCHHLAVALYRAFGWPIFVLSTGKEYHHAFLRTTDDMSFFDARGRVPEDVLTLPFHDVPYTQVPLTESELQRLPEWKVSDVQCEAATQVAQFLFPDLPWNHDDSIAGRFQRFADAFESLCRQHGIWMRSQVPAQPPVLYVADGDGDEDGYDLDQFDPQQCTINRRFSEGT